MKLDFNIDLPCLGADKISKINLAQTIAAYIYNNKTDELEPIKAIKWAEILYEKKPIDVDESEADLLKKIIKNSHFPNFIRAKTEEIIIKALNPKGK